MVAQDLLPLFRRPRVRDGVLASRVERQGVDGSRMSATVEFHGQFRARLAEISQWKAERDHGVQLWRARRAADPADFPVSTEEFRSVGRHSRVLQQ